MTREPEIDISVVIGFKDWGLSRLRLAVETLIESCGSLNGEVIVSDYGSTDCPEAGQIVEGLGGRYVYTETDGVWSRSRALNAGFAIARGQVLVSTDADMLFSPRAMEIVGRRVIDDPATGLALQCRDLPAGMDSDWVTENGKQWSLFADVSSLRPRWGMGGMMAIARQAFLDVRGFDERMQIYGGEDLDFAQRIRRSGRRIHWIEDPDVRMYHMWHASSRNLANETTQGRAAIDYNRDIYLNDPSVVRNTTRWRHRPPDAPPIVSVVIATRNRAQFLRASVQSALAQTVQDLEVIVVDDGSEDDTKAVMDEIRDPRLTYVASPGRGIAAARNFAATLSRGRYTVVQDDDDLMMPQRVEHHLAALQAGDSGSYGAWVDFDGRDGSVLSVNRGRDYSLTSLLFAERVFAHPTLMIETRLIRDVGYDERFRSGSDYNLAIRLARLGIRLRHTGHVHTVRRMHPQQVTATDSPLQQSAGRWSTAAALGLIPLESHGVLRNVARQQPEVDLGLDDAAVAELVKPYLPDELVQRDVHVVVPQAVGLLASSAAEVTEVEDLLQPGSENSCCMVVRNASWEDLARLSKNGGVSILASRTAGGSGPTLELTPLEHAQRLSSSILAARPFTDGALLVGHSELVEREDGSLLGHWRIAGQETYLIALPLGKDLVDRLEQAGHHVRRIQSGPRPGSVRPTAALSPSESRMSDRGGDRKALKAPPKPREATRTRNPRSQSMNRSAKVSPAPSRRHPGSAGRPRGQVAGRVKGQGPARPVRPRPSPPPRRRRYATPRRLAAGVVAVIAVALTGGLTGYLLDATTGTLVALLALWLVGTAAFGLVLSRRILSALARVEAGHRRRSERLQHALRRQQRRSQQSQRRELRRARQQARQSRKRLEDHLTRRLSKQTSESAQWVAAQAREAVDEVTTTLTNKVVNQVDSRMAAASKSQSAELQQAVTHLAERQRAALDVQLKQTQSLLNLLTLVRPTAATPALGGWAASADVLLLAVDELLSSRPAVVLECGSGASTVWFALAARQYELDTKIIALEHDERFARATREHLKRHGLDRHAEVRLAGLTPVEAVPGHDTPWYDPQAVADVSDIGLLFVDGPPGPTGKDARLPAVHLLRQRFAEHCTIVLDDANRPEERTIAARWQALLPDFSHEELPFEKGAAVFRRCADTVAR